MALFRPIWQTDVIKADSRASNKKIQKALVAVEGIRQDDVLLGLACDAGNRQEVREAAAGAIAGVESRVQLLLHPVPSAATKLAVLRRGLPPEAAASFLLLYEQTAAPPAPAHLDEAVIEGAAAWVSAEDLAWRVYERAKTWAVQRSMVARMNDERLLVEVAARHPQASLRIAAIDRIPQNSACLVGLALKDTQPAVWQAALDRMADEELLLQVAYESAGERRQMALAHVRDAEKLAQAYLRMGTYDDVPAEFLFTTKNQALLHRAVEHGIQRAQGKTGVEWFGWMNYIAAALQNCRDRKTLCRVADREDLQPRVRIEAYSRLSGERRLLWADLIELLEPKETPDSEAAAAERRAAAASLNAALGASEELQKPEGFVRYVRTAIAESGILGGPSF